MRKYLGCSENEQKSTIEEVTSCLDTAKANEDMRTSIVLPCTCYICTLPPFHDDDDDDDDHAMRMAYA
jgi:hypothetical protein